MVINIITFEPAKATYHLAADGSPELVPSEDAGLNIRGGGFLIGFILTRVGAFLLYFTIGWHNHYASLQFRGVLWTTAFEVISITTL